MKHHTIKHGFALRFPATFTMDELLEQTRKRKIKYITLRARVQKALKTGTVVIAGEVVTPNGSGRRPIIYQRVDAKVTSATIPGKVSVIA
jgi:uncharacterized protein YaiL (DUF2058 family)